MLLTTNLNKRRIAALPLLFLIWTLFYLLFYSGSHLSLSENVAKWHQPRPSDPLRTAASPEPTAGSEILKALDEPVEYNLAVPSENFCATRFSVTYLEDFRDHAASYCEPNSHSSLTCFHTHSRPDGQSDSFCIGRGVALDPSSSRFHLDCAVRQLETEELKQGIVPLEQLRGYMYETGPVHLFKDFIDLSQSEATVKRSETTKELLPSDRPRASDVPLHQQPPKNFLLLKREGETNPWHCIMEIFSTYMSFDVLRISRDPSRAGAPYFNIDEAEDTQVVILDDRADGPFFDLWTLFARRKPVRLKELLSDPAAVAAVQDASIILPLPGGSNPLWQDEWKVQLCRSAPILEVFSRRVLDFYTIKSPPARQVDDPIIVTFIDRKQTRRLRQQASLFEALEKRGLHIKTQLIDFAAYSIAEQIRIAHETDVLIGVHGAGLSHAMFMRKGEGVVVEIQPISLDQKGYRNIANFMGLGYFHIHAPSVPMDAPDQDSNEKKDKERRDLDTLTSSRIVTKRAEWHFQDVQVDQERFLNLIEIAVKSLYGKGSWNYEVN